jgi:hypothetical protein
VRQNYSEWASSQHLEGLRPYANGAGEVDYWRLELALNRLGLAFLEVDHFALTGDRQLTS